MDDLLRSILNPGEMTFTIEDADMDKLYEVLSDVNIKDCPYFEIHDKYGNFAKYYREDQPVCKKGKWIDAVLPNDNGGLPVQVCDQCNTFFPLAYTGGGHHYCPNCGARMEGEGC